jgi:hypothetical protein
MANPAESFGRSDLFIPFRCGDRTGKVHKFARLGKAGSEIRAIGLLIHPDVRQSALAATGASRKAISSGLVRHPDSALEPFQSFA